MRVSLQEAEHKHKLEVEEIQSKNRNDLELIQQKIQAALAKKKEIIDSLHDELKMKDL